jgi:KDO2-lipid IV(A) lauroyltransferase
LPDRSILRLFVISPSTICLKRLFPKDGTINRLITASMSLKKRFNPLRRRIKYSLLYVMVLVIIRISQFLPRQVWLSFCGVLGYVYYLLSAQSRRKVRHHLSFAYRQEMSTERIRSLTRQVFVMLGKNAGVILREFITSTKRFRQQAVVTGLQYAQQAFDSGRGVIFLTAHLGPFESIATELALRGFHPYIVGTPLKHKLLNELLIRQRTKFGAVAIERGKETYRVMKNISKGGTMAILIDQDTKVKSVFVNFFGHPCSTPAGATLMAIKTGAAVIPVFAHLNKDGTQEINYYPEVTLTVTGNEEQDVLVNTQTFTTIIENEIRKRPEQWVWMHRRWRTVPVA